MSRFFCIVSARIRSSNSISRSLAMVCAFSGPSDDLPRPGPSIVFLASARKELKPCLEYPPPKILRRLKLYRSH